MKKDCTKYFRLLTLEKKKNLNFQTDISYTTIMLYQ